MPQSPCVLQAFEAAQLASLPARHSRAGRPGSFAPRAARALQRPDSAHSSEFLQSASEAAAHIEPTREQSPEALQLLLLRQSSAATATQALPRGAQAPVIGQNEAQRLESWLADGGGVAAAVEVVLTVVGDCDRWSQEPQSEASKPVRAIASKKKVRVREVIGRA